MKKLFICSSCKQTVYRKGIRGFSHITCPNCKSKYELSNESLKFYAVFPFIAVGISVFLSVQFIKTNDIFIKGLFIFSISYMIYYLLCIIMIHIHRLQYVKR